MPLPAPCIACPIDPVSVLGLLSQPCPWIIQPEVTSYLRCGDHCLPPTEVSSSTQDKSSDSWKLYGV
ncbi:hypothetical protein CHARACLAT_016916 [Characodon lateralis]|uniref:Uncharacterized protein n=1 Tax=Characodon lateralis TaxID=208331 RepID=A0ABU7CNV7_9TELE|nr:hypothetical protein [Characodon lateralis]